MKKILPLAALLVVLLAVYFLFFWKSAPDNEFHIPDAKAVRKVEMEKVVKGESTRKILLERVSPEEWKVDGKYVAQQRKVEEFLLMLTQIRVQKPVEAEGLESALGLLKRNHTLVKITDADGEIIKEYLVGATNNQQTTNIMMIAGASKAWYVGRPGHVGYVSIMYSTDPQEWRELMMWNQKGNELAAVSAEYGAVADGFRIQRKAVDANWAFEDGTPVNQDHVDQYLKQFDGKVYAESLAEVANPGLRDSLLRRTPDVVFAFQNLNGGGDQLKLFIRPENPNSYFGYMESQKEAYTVQHHVIDKFLKTKGYFVVQPS